MDSEALENRLHRELEQRTRLLKQSGDLAYLLNVHIVGVSHGDAEHLEQIHTLLYKEFEEQAISIYRRVLKQLDGNATELTSVISAIDRALRDWCKSLVDYARKCVETVAKLSFNRPPAFEESSVDFYRTVTVLLDDFRKDAETWVVKGEHMRQQTSATTGSIPSWFPKAGFASAAIAFFFVIALVIMETLGRQVPSTARVLVDLALAIAIACAFAFFGGTAKAEGKIPFLKNYEPIRFATGGGIAVFVIVLVLCVWVYH